MPSERALPPFFSSFRGGGAPPCAESACFLSPFREYAACPGRAEGLFGRGKNLHMGEAGLWAVPPVMTKARLRAKAHACGEGGMPTEPDGTGPQLRRGEGGAIRTGVMSVRRIPVRRPLIAHGEEVCAGTSVQGGAVFSCSCVGPFLREGDSGVSGAVGHPWQVVLRWRGFPGRRRKRGAFCRRETGRGLRGRRGCAFSGKKPRLRPSGAELRGA